MSIEIETCKSHKKHYDSKLKEQEKKIAEMQEEHEKMRVAIEVSTRRCNSKHPDPHGNIWN